MTKWLVSIPYKSRLNLAAMTLCSVGRGSLLLLLAILFFHDSLVEWLTPVLATLGMPGTTDAASRLFLVVAPLALLLNYADQVVSRHRALQLGSDFIRFPWHFALTLRLRLQRRWNDVSHVAILRRGKALTLFFRSGGYACLDLHHINENLLEQLLLSIEMRAQHIADDPGFQALLNEIDEKKTSKGELSFTRIWETELSQRFISVPFIPLEPGQTLKKGRLKIVRQLAIGGLSSVYLARYNEQHVVLKESAIPETADPSLRQKAQQMMQREASLLLVLDHPQIVKVFDCFTERDRTYLLLEYLTGETLREIVIQHGALPESTVLDWAGQLAPVLVYLHSQEPPVIHRDLTPENVIVRTNRKLTVVDFGAANEFLGQATGTFVGKQAYTAPEQFRGKATPQSDIYALGCTLHYLLTGRDPEPLSQSHPCWLNKDVSQDMDRLVADCTSPDPMERIKNSNELIMRLSMLATPGFVTSVSG